MKYRVALLAGAALAFHCSGAMAQAAGQLDEIVVTASRRDQNLQDTPVAVQLVTGEELQNRQLTTTTDIQYAAPSLTYLQGTSLGSGSFSMRGVGTIGFAPSVEQSVGLVVDGISIGARSAGEGALLDLASVQVLRGPQGMLFGKNASAGLIVMTTQAPVLNELSARMRAEYGTLNSTMGSVVVNAPVGDTAAFRLAGSFRQRDGLQTNLTTGEKYNDDHDLYLRARGRWQVTERLRLDVGAHHEQIRVKCCAGAMVIADTRNANVRNSIAAGLTPGRNNRDAVLTPGLPYGTTGNSGQFLELNYDLGPATLTSLTGHITFEQQSELDSDFSAALVTRVYTAKNLDETTQEFRLTSNEPLFSSIDYVVGAYIYHHKYVQDNQIIGTPNTRTHDFVKNNSFAIFGQATWHATEKLRLILGGRYTDDDVTQDSYTGRPLGLPLVLTSGGASSKNFSPRGIVQYDWSPDVMTFASVTKGYKGPAFSQVPPSVAGTPGRPFQVEPEISTEYSVGLRSQFFERRAMANITGFHHTFTNYQAVQFDPVAFVSLLRNAGKVRTQGVELELAAKPFPGWTITNNTAYVDSKFIEYRNVACSTVYAFYVPTACPGGLIDASGQSLPDSSKLTTSLIVDYEREVSSNLLFTMQGGYNYRSKVNYQSTGDPFFIQKGYGLVNLNASIGATDGGWRFSVFARNLLDQNFSPALQATTGNAGISQNRSIFLAARRFVGVSFDVKFGGAS